MQRLCLLGFAVLYLGVLATANKYMIMGRPRHGFVPPPTSPTEGDTFANANYLHQFQQKLDHFDSNNNAQWTQQYWYNPSYYKAGGPAFLMLGGEAPANVKWVTLETLTFMKLAKKYNAAVFQLEHRFYGNSRPTPNQNVSSLKWLSSRQALEDAANFIQAMNAMYKTQWGDNMKWITFGGSYSGALSAWMREQYPNLVAGAVASSGPVFAELDFKEYLDVVQTALRSYSADCANNVRIGFQQMLDLTTTADGRQNLTTTFNTCQTVDTLLKDSKDAQNFYGNVIGNFMGVVQYSQDNVGDYANRLTIPNLCQLMNDNSRPYVTRLNDVNLFVNGAGTCMDNSYAEFIRYVKDESFDAPLADARSWIWQTCTEFAYFQSTDFPYNIFGQIVPLSFYIDMCTDTFGANYYDKTISTAVDQTNTFYGGRDNYKGTNVVLPNGSIDPWHALGILKTQSGSTAVAVLIEGTAHCADMYPSRDSDRSGLTAARVTIDNNIAVWLQQQGSPSPTSSSPSTTTSSPSTTTTSSPPNNHSGANSVYVSVIALAMSAVVALLR